MVRGAGRMRVWFTTYYDSSTGVSGELCRVDANGGVTKRNIGLFASGIVTGPDGNFWIADGNAYIARVTPTGVVTKFPLTAGRKHRARRTTSRSSGWNLWSRRVVLPVLDVVSTAGHPNRERCDLAATPVSTGILHVTFGSDVFLVRRRANIGRVSNVGRADRVNGFLGTLLDLNGIGFTPPIVSASDENILDDRNVV